MAVNPVPEGYSAVTPYLVVRDAPALIVFLERAFGGRERMRMTDSTGAIRHGEVEIGNARLMLADASEEFPPIPAMLHLYVEEVDAVYRSALDAGAESLAEPADQFYGDRMAGVRDAFGNQWWIATHIEDVSAEEAERRQRELTG
jgi:PhnB protein